MFCTDLLARLHHNTEEEGFLDYTLLALNIGQLLHEGYLLSKGLFLSAYNKVTCKMSWYVSHIRFYDIVR